jgi:hypothetical protein
MVGPGFFDGLYFRQLIKGGIGNGFLLQEEEPCTVARGVLPVNYDYPNLCSRSCGYG